MKQRLEPSKTDRNKSPTICNKAYKITKIQFPLELPIEIIKHCILNNVDNKTSFVVFERIE
jgi:hypothetical protein